LVEDSNLDEGLIDAKQFATILRVTEADVLEWSLDGHIPHVDSPDGSPRFRVSQQHTVDGPVSSWFGVYPISNEPSFRATLARRQREHQLAALDWGDVDVGAFAAAFAARLRAVAPSSIQVVVEQAMVWLRYADGTGAGIDMASYASSSEAVAGPERVRVAAASALAHAQDELAEATTDPWPRHGPGELPDPHADITPKRDVVRMFYGDPASPVLELEPLRVADVLSI
jgi:hypothetical protein